MEFPSNDIKKQEHLEKIATLLEKDRVYKEEELNIIIKEKGYDDFPLIRRELVNFNYLAKDSYKGTYWLKKQSLSNKELEKINILQNKLKKLE